MSIPTLYYFDGRARGECSRLLYVYSGKQFNDARQPWPIKDDMKTLATFGQLPYLEDGDVHLAQTVAIEYYIAEQCNLLGSTPAERAQVLQFACLPADLYNPYFLCYLNKDEVNMAKFRTEKAPFVLKKLEAAVIKAGGEHLVGKTITWADITIFNVLDFFYQQPYNLIEVLQPFPALIEFHKKIGAIPQIAEYLKNRPKSIF
ncbi:hypothetical protein SAMD00019534_002970 [Acytostelium subglobosum LB1]|uniref:hypothetical protein n=1 Tax=Acytostelium subglobosum LB1 TaxID=1410327 RepID=UPI000644D5A2|nr:hypothetical protein SAMD00019534_002970 [Acytostelium subglobosum LB1]GAM17122.1 hypothetical protein SAMD00019534_002970 [Acytostelium subglobosum LB1]|eukprot:XP_012759184.1 hypothetical protein SAMD00019534_002970 [Acytostelium subglobosum LB1]